MSNKLIRNGDIVLDGTIIPDEYADFYELGAFSPAMVRDALSNIDGDVVIWVNSPGGDPIGGEAIRVMFAEHSGKVTVKVAGDAASAASLMIMGAETIEISEGSVIMIHDPATITMGDAQDHARSLEMLNVIADTYAAVYAKRAGKTKDEVRALMKAETWMGPAEAITEGFADVMLGKQKAAPLEMTRRPDLSIEAAKANHTLALTMLSSAAKKMKAAPNSGSEQAAEISHHMAASAAKEVKMTKKPDAAANGGNTGQQVVTPPASETNKAEVQMTAEDAVKAERDRSRGITMAARPHVASGAVDEAFVEALVDEGVSVEMASHRILQKLSGAETDIQMRSPAGSVRVGREDRETRRDGMTMALTARLTGKKPEDDRARPFLGMSIHEMAATAIGKPLPGFGSYAQREDILMSAMHSTSDFPNILSTSVNRVLASQYELVDRTFTAISREMTFNDFRAHDIVRPDEYPTLTKVSETGEIKFGKLGDSKETVALAAYATGISISRQALVNDDLGAIQDVIDNAAAIVPEFEEDVFWALFLSNPALADGTAMFHADHGNLAGSGTAITVAAIGAGRQALRTMKAADGKRTIKMNGPSVLLVGPAKETEAEQFLKATNETKAADVNPFSGKLSLAVSEAITGNQWYLTVDPSKRTHNFKHGYLRDRTAPRVRVDEPFGVQGMRMTLEHDFGAGGVNHRGAYKNPGA